MNLKNTFKYHLLLAFIIIAMHILDEYNKMGSKIFFNELALGISYLTTFNIAFFGTYVFNYKVICPNTLAKKKILLFIIGLFSLSFVFAGIRFLMEEIIMYSITGFHNYGDRTRTFWYYIFDNAFYALKAGLFSAFMYFLFNYLRSMSKIHQLQIERQKAELDILKTQLEPHFLFNTLNIFYSELAESKPETAKGIYKLSELLRYLTYETKEDFMPLTQEIKFIKDYMYFYEKRFENNFHLDFTIKGAVTTQKMPSLILIHFVENIFKHGIINDMDHPAKITIDITSDFLEITTENKISIGQNYSGSGIGKENLKKRLQLLFEDAYELKHDEAHEIYTAYLKIPLKN
ncbi:sensor histidine kinase [uncultured Kordia sp.]|uniref:sensor histidine kinase n=1 Tax=uncultured Kordia sp. TaxID=507699 RepID=UPI0026124FF3|nr:histidine kinase [uncultured Kordia sp.]